ncbi:methyltransferase family protein [Christiangramia aestuarii]|nr:isoprenylcysteine carboxylmethyltransferase family protein [Christiangramia aestuarii]
MLNAKDYKLVGVQVFLFILYYFELPVLQLSFPDFVKSTALALSGFGVIIFLLAMLQLNKNLSPFPTPRAGSKLVKTGLYKYIRHPIYTGILIGLGSFSIYTNSGFRVMICLGLYVLFSVKTAYEEKLLLQKFSDYREYQKRTGRFFPK